MVADFWAEARELVTLGFRGAGKTTLLEEDLALAAGEGWFRYCLIIGSKEERAAEPLAAVKNELAMNEEFRAVYGDLVGETWTQTKAVLKTGAVIQAIGRDQDIRGIKHLDWRPDLVVAIDFEDKDTVQTPEGRRHTLRWFLAELLPACDRARRRVRVQATPMDRESVPLKLVGQSGWASRVYPLLFLDEDGEERSSWPAKFPVEEAQADRAAYRRLGEGDLWDREYMCRAVSDEARVFRAEDIRVVPRDRLWEGVWCMVDPARTVKRTSASTGWAAWSWVRNRLVVWDAGAELLLPDAIVDLGFRLNEEHRPIEVGFEEDGLNEWLLQPLRQAGLTRRVSLPLRAVKAPRGKIDFIRTLQPFFKAGEVELARPCEALVEQLLGFPTGRIDAPNALAYAVLNRPGLPIYDGFDPRDHIAAELAEIWGKPVFLAANAQPALVTAALMQVVDGVLCVLADWIVEDEVASALSIVAREASLLSGRSPVLVAGPDHYRQHLNVGLIQAAKALPMETRRGGDPQPGRAYIADQMALRRRGRGAIAVSETARWTLNALAGGYARPLQARGFGAEAERGRYRVLMEGIESFAALLAVGVSDEDEEASANYAYDRQGRRYRSAMPGLGRPH